jgi:putative ABC transport system permease protein
METIDIHWSSLAISFLLLAFPIIISFYLKLKLSKDIGISVVRMSVQLVLIGIFLQYLFKWNNAFVNIGWLMVMIITAVFSAAKNAEIKLSFFLLPALIAFTFSTFFIIFFINLFVLKIPNIFEAKYLVVLSGMLLGNVLRGNIIGINSFYSNLKKDEAYYQYLLSTGATQIEALLPYLRNSMRLALSPTIATMATMGLVALPGMMTGTILGGSSPLVAIKYQIMIMIAIFSCTNISVLGTIYLSLKKSFNEYGILKAEM